VAAAADAMFCFVTVDILCGKIASIITSYVIAELNIKDNFSRISMFFFLIHINGRDKYRFC